MDFVGKNIIQAFKKSVQKISVLNLINAAPTNAMLEPRYNC